MRSFPSILIFISWLPLVTSSCKKFLEVDPPKSVVVRETVFKDDATAISAMVGIYLQLNGGFAAGAFHSVTVNAGLSADELVNHYEPSDAAFFYKNSLTPQLKANYDIWGTAYEVIYAANAVLDGIAKSTTLTTGVKTQLEGEAKFIRAFAHFYLVNLYGDVPLITTTDYAVNRLAPRMPTSVVYDQIVKDLKDAEQLLSIDYITTEKVRPNKAAAMALLARVYLYQGLWADAETEAGFVLTDSRYGLESDLNKTFLSNSKEAIWQIIDPFANTYTNEGVLFILTAAPDPVHYVSLDTNLVKSFDTSDLRRKNWIGSLNNTYYYPWKYKNNKSTISSSEYSMVLRLAELYLIRAEARAQQNKITGNNSALSDLNAILTRANLPSTTATTKEGILLAIEVERRKELFAEWGHRWLDLKRTGRANTLLSGKPNWTATDVLYPIPELDMLANPKLKPQNPGY